MKDCKNLWRRKWRAGKSANVHCCTCRKNYFGFHMYIRRTGAGGNSRFWGTNFFIDNCVILSEETFIRNSASLIWSAFLGFWKTCEGWWGEGCMAECCFDSCSQCNVCTMHRSKVSPNSTQEMQSRMWRTEVIHLCIRHMFSCGFWIGASNIRRSLHWIYGCVASRVCLLHEHKRN